MTLFSSQALLMTWTILNKMKYSTQIKITDYQVPSLNILSHYYYCIAVSSILHCTSHFCIFYPIYSYLNPWKFFVSFPFYRWRNKNLAKLHNSPKSGVDSKWMQTNKTSFTMYSSQPKLYFKEHHSYQPWNFSVLFSIYTRKL